METNSSMSSFVEKKKNYNIVLEKNPKKNILQKIVIKIVKVCFELYERFKTRSFSYMHHVLRKSHQIFNRKICTLGFSKA